MMLTRVVLTLLLGASLAVQPAASTAQAGIGAENDRATLDFPESVTFAVDLESEAEIEEVVLEYGVERLTCGTVIAKAFPEFTPSTTVEAEWTWEMRQSGSEPPGALIWWRWRATDADGNDLLTERQTITWLDDEHPWETISGDWLNLHWYDGGQAFGRELYDAADAALGRLAQDTGLEPDGPIDLRIYADTEDLRDAVLYEPGWTGGQAYPDYNIVLIGISPVYLEWGKRTEAHELTHVLVGRFTFTCLGSVPTWLNEGLAVYGEGGLDEDERQQLDDAIADDDLLSVRALGGRFSEHPDRAELSYSQSYSLVDMLIREYGQQKILDLLSALRDGSAIDDALETTYGFEADGLEDAWRTFAGAQPRREDGVTPTPTPAPTPVPTLVPIAGVPTTDDESPEESEPAAPQEEESAPPEGDSPPAGLPGWALPALIAAACAVTVGLIVVAAVVRRSRRNS